MSEKYYENIDEQMKKIREAMNEIQNFDAKENCGMKKWNQSEELLKANRLLSEVFKELSKIKTGLRRNPAVIRKVSVLNGRAKNKADKMDLEEDDLVIVRIKNSEGSPLPEYELEKIEGDPVSYMLDKKERSNNG